MIRFFLFFLIFYLSLSQAQEVFDLEKKLSKSEAEILLYELTLSTQKLHYFFTNDEALKNIEVPHNKYLEMDFKKINQITLRLLNNSKKAYKDLKAHHTERSRINFTQTQDFFEMFAASLIDWEKLIDSYEEINIDKKKHKIELETIWGAINFYTHESRLNTFLHFEKSKIPQTQRLKIISELKKSSLIGLKLHHQYFTHFESRIKEISQNDCQINYFWGHGGDVARIFDELAKINTPNLIYLGQGCNIGSIGNIDDIIAQNGPNGTWIKELHYNHNGGFNPIMLENCIHVTEFNKCELDYVVNKYYKQHSSKYPKVDDFRKDVVIQINAVGFMRLTEENWKRALMQVENVFQKEACSQKEKIKVVFHCWEGMNSSIYRGRVARAKGDKIFMRDHKGQAVSYQGKLCAVTSDGKQIYSIPSSCQDSGGKPYSLELSREDMINLKKGNCFK